MNKESDWIIDQAVAWHFASDGDDMDWNAFTAWLEADPRHRAAYDEIALTEAKVAEHANRLAAPAAPVASSPVFAANDLGEPAVPTSLARRWMPWAGGAIAASLVALALVPQLRTPDIATYATADTARSIALEDGSRIQLAPRSKLTIDGRHQERLALEGGAWFDIRHDPARSLVIRAGEVQISDIGTSFDVQVEADRVRIEVADGEVSLTSPALEGPVRLVAGRGFFFDSAAGRAVTRAVDRSNFGEWREGRLSYDQEPLTLVAADLSRYAGIRLTVAKGIGNRQFSGTLATGDGKAAVRDLSQLMGLALRRVGDGYRLESPGG